MFRIVRKIHIYLGLLSFSILLVYGIAGLTATFQPAPEARRQPEPAVRYEAFIAPPQATDKQVADLVYEQLKPPLSGPVPGWALQHDREGNLRFTFYSVNGPRQITVLENEKRLRTETRRNTIWHYFDNLHSTMAARGQEDLRMRLWGWYNEFSIFTLLAMALTGMAQWLLSRPWFRLAQASVAAGFGVFIALFFWMR